MVLYTILLTIMAALYNIEKGNVTLEHVSSTATSGLLHKDYPIYKYIITPEV